MQNKLVVILGQTASGKTDLSVKLAKKFRGEIVSADSRQVYKGLNIGSGKVTKKEMAGIPHYLLDVANPKTKFTVAQFQKLGVEAIKKIHTKNKLPFLVGGTGFYIQSIVDGIVIPEVAPNQKLRKKLSGYKVERLYEMLKKLDPMRAKSIDAKNPIRLIRAIEIIEATKKPVTPLKKNPQFEVLQLGIKKPAKELKKLIEKRLQKRIKGIITEVKKLHNPPAGGGLSFKRLEELGLEYRYVAQYIQGKIDYQEMITILQKESEHFAKRQLTWFKRDKKIHWIKNQKQAEKLIKNFLQ
ncbi:MAG: tRNA (adenosine(37)-N6)-dimethylallyltransferase MiaA [Candidatus Staskawiczbacteria bacterium]|nr:tRNA (adenosine(37)-N6)-dimethylallyltransferase MiaA [Candidatus Staskawiczbacteria bacterium]